MTVQEESPKAYYQENEAGRLHGVPLLRQSRVFLSFDAQQYRYSVSLFFLATNGKPILLAVPGWPLLLTLS
ncbi:hypothetical protein [Collimonas silvisoli]|uniref:hypothetical protein n=1 Tax=Collimonas silvisoli TaxID=2825884 RepID=UPI001B8C817A|nr:hypothetical protein [Collimonas silvisoli]